jgi:hypothetical protein
MPGITALQTNEVASIRRDDPELREAGLVGYYFFPPLGEAVVASVIEVCPDTKFSDFVGAGKVIDMMSVASSDETMAVDVISSALRREGRALVDHSL